VNKTLKGSNKSKWTCSQLNEKIKKKYSHEMESFDSEKSTEAPNVKRCKTEGDCKLKNKLTKQFIEDHMPKLGDNKR
jgi:hypothetical protein